MSDFVLRSLGRLRLALACLLALAFFGAPLRADPVADFYRGRTLTLLSGFTPSGENDVYFRLLGRHISRFIPGQPQVLSSNMTGAGTLIAANHLYKVAAPDGTVLAMFTAQAAVEPFLHNRQATFDPLKFGWIGSISKDLQFCAVVPAPGVPETFEQLSTKEVVFGVGPPATDIYKHTAVLKNVLGARLRMVSGYAGMPDINLALQRGELTGVCGLTAAALRTNFGQALAGGRLKLLVQMGGSRSSEFGNVPSVFDFARSDGEREVLDYFFNALAIGRPIAAPPGVPIERLAALRTAFAAVLQDSAFLSEAKTLGMVIDPASAADLEGQMKRLSDYPHEFYEKVRLASE